MHSFRCSARILVALVAVAMASDEVRAGDGAGPLRFNRDIRPILSDRCFRCHGPDRGARKADLRLDIREEAIRAGALVPGEPGRSELIRRVFAEDSDERMPPRELHKDLSEAEKGRLRDWVEGGAPYESHWAYLPIERPMIPVVSGPARSLLTPVDAFILDRLRREGLEPGDEADRRTLLRRLSLDLTGLPPTVAELEAFLRDDGEYAYERQVERLLASPHFGERQAVPWLDAVRFADTVGYHGDQNQRIFPYRDYVIESFNRNKPFDAFTVEQIAGDLLPDPTVAQRVATGFNRLNMMTREGGAQPKEYLAKYQADRVRTVSTAWLGSTMACAECHDHKYDPFTTRDFYAMEAFFADLVQWGVYNDYSYTPNPDLRGWSNDHPFPPEIEVESPYLRQRMFRLAAEERKVEEAASDWLLKGPQADRDRFRKWRQEVNAFLEANPDGWRVPRVERVETRSGDEYVVANHAVVESDGSIQMAESSVTQDRVVLEPGPGWVSAIRLELLPAVPSGSVFRGDRLNGRVSWSVVRRGEAEDKEEGLSFWFADAEAKEPRYSNGEEILGILGGWFTRAEKARERQVAVGSLDRPFRAEAGDRLVVRLPNNGVARWRIAISPLAPDRSRWSTLVTEVWNALGAGRGVWEPAAHAAFHRSTRWDEATTRRLRDLDREIRECRGGRAWTLVAVAKEPMVTRVLPRGNWMDDSGPIVEPATPHFLPARSGEGTSKKATQRLTRLDLARWLISTDNPLTARNQVNRFWAQFFGAGISGRIEDLGLQGEWPTHPELLDWLAAEFMAPTLIASPVAGVRAPHAWDVQHVIRLLVNSATYRRSAVPSAKAMELDPENRLYSRQSPRRLDAEFVRDYALGVAGLLEASVGGPSVYPYQPADYYANLQFPDRRYEPNADARQYRRGLYTHWQRTFLHPMMANFDAPSREECVASRLTSNTPQQALTLLNDPTFVEASRVLAENLIRQEPEDNRRLIRLFRTVLLREPEPGETRSLGTFASEQEKWYEERPGEAEKLVRTGFTPVANGLSKSEVAAWANVARVVLNLHETITRY